MQVSSMVQLKLLTTRTCFEFLQLIRSLFFLFLVASAAQRILDATAVVFVRDSLSPDSPEGEFGYCF